MKFLGICAFLIATVAKTHAGIINAGLGHGVIGARATIAAAPAAAVAAASAPLPAAPVPVATATLAAAAIPQFSVFQGLPALPHLSALAALPAPTITVGAPLPPLATLAANAVGARALLGAHAAPFVLPALAGPYHGGILAGHALPAHL